MKGLWPTDTGTHGCGARLWPGSLLGTPLSGERGGCPTAERVPFPAGASASPLKVLCTPEGIRLQCFLKYFTEEMRVNWYHK